MLSLALLGVLGGTACATSGMAVNETVPGNTARYICGSAGAQPPSLQRCQVANVVLRTSSDVELVLDVGRHGTIAIPYASISYLSYGPSYSPSREAGGYPYKWSTSRHRFSQHYLKVGFRRDSVAEETVVLALGRGLVPRTFASLERRSSKTIGFGALEACTHYRTPEDCGIGTPTELKGLSAVLIDTGGSKERNAGHSYAKISAVIDEARLGLRLVSTPEDAGIVLRFSYIAGSGWMPSQVSPPDRAVGEVYVARPDGLRVLMTFDETMNVFRTDLAERFAQAFIREYRKGNP